MLIWLPISVTCPSSCSAAVAYSGVRNSTNAYLPFTLQFTTGAQPGAWDCGGGSSGGGGVRQGWGIARPRPWSSK
jgi:hypothetical protein